MSAQLQNMCASPLQEVLPEKKTRPVEVQNGYPSGESFNVPTTRLRRFKNKTKIVYMFMELASVKCVSRMSKLQTHVIHMVWSSELRRFFFLCPLNKSPPKSQPNQIWFRKKIHKITKTKPREKTVTNALGPELRWWWNFWEETVILITPQTQPLFLGSIRRS